MTNETRQRIKMYENFLPEMREKVMAAVLMLVVAVVVVASATYAWVTLSTSPEATSIDTTVIANGNLEIALANGEGTAPGKSAAGDSSATEGTAVTSSNVTWGNLINLSDPSYGLSSITLRPAALNGTSGLLSNPLYGVAYGEDGRVTEMTTDDDFAYVYYDTDKKTFMVDTDSNHYGVRAVSTVLYQNLEGDKTLSELVSSVKKEINAAKTNYDAMTNESAEPGKSYIASLEGLIQVYAQNQLDRKAMTELDVTAYVESLYDMMQYFNDYVMEHCGQAYVYMADMCEFIKTGAESSDYTIDTLCAAALKNTLKDYVNISSLKEYAQDRSTLTTYLRSDFENMTDAQKKSSLAYWADKASNGDKVYWSDINTIVNWVCQINTCTVDGYPMSSISSYATKIIGGSSPHSAVINGGCLQRMEQRIGQKMSPEVSIVVDASSISKLLGKVTLTAIVTTSASEPYEMPTDLNTIKNSSSGTFKGTDATAEDTYALAIDFWVRTNAGSTSESVTTTETSVDAETGVSETTAITYIPEKAYLTLEGNVITETVQVEAVTKDINGDEQDLYVASYEYEESGETKTGKTEVYKRTGTYYYLVTDENTGEVTEHSFKDEIEKLGLTEEDVTYTRKMEETEVVVGYEGANRVWSEDQMIAYSGSGTSTTQGQGSCYIFYADTPADQSRFLELLDAMKVVFVNSDGKQIGTATMDTENYYALNGKVVVPVVLDTVNAISLGTDIDGNNVYGLTSLEKGAATRITVLVYLDGSKLTNDMVLASGDIQGSLSIQFGSVVVTATETTVTSSEEGSRTETSYTIVDDSSALEYESVMDDYIQVSASVSQSSFDYDKDNAAISGIQVSVSGVEPKNVSVRFTRVISSTQGVLQDSVTLTNTDGTWTGDCTFAKPGNYVLRSVWVDGIEYSLDTPVQVTVSGVAVDSLVCDAITTGREATILTADRSYSTNLTLGFSSSEVLPSSVRGLFFDKKGRQNTVTFTMDESGTSWSGKATFSTSETYTLMYIEIDGEIYELQEEKQITLEVLLGLKARTWITCDAETLENLRKTNSVATATSFTLSDASVTLQVSLEIYDNSGEEITGLDEVKLVYGKVGSSIKKVDGNFKWDSETGRYEGEFLVTEAGTYQFKQVSVGSNVITSYTSAPKIQAMPPADAYYFNQYTEDYQYAPNEDATITIGVAYSSAASMITAEISNGTNSYTVEGTIGLEAEDQGNESVNLWSFKVPQVNDTQEGTWQLTSITLYGVYYDETYYDETNGVTIDLQSENITTKVVCNIYVTISGTSQEFNGYFMDSHKITDMTVTIADANGEAVQGVTVSGVKLVYYLDYSTVSMNTYGYTAEGLETVSVSGDGTLRTGSSTVFDISELNFQVAGNYKTCAISFMLNGVSYQMGSSSSSSGNIKLRYLNNGAQTESCPEYTVYWTAPTVTITATDPEPGESYNINLSSNSSASTTYSVENYFEDYYAYVNIRFIGLRIYSLPKITFELSDAGSNLSSATFTIESESNTSSSNYNQTVTFTSKNLSKTTEIGTMENLVQRRTIGTQIIKNIVMNYNGTAYTMALSHEVEIREKNEKYKTVSYEIPEEYESIFTAPESQTNSPDGRAIKVTLPTTLTGEVVEEGRVESTKTVYSITTTKQPITYSGKYIWNVYYGYKVTTVKKTVQLQTCADVTTTYTTSPQWKNASTSQVWSAGTKLSFTTDTVLTAVISKDDVEEHTVKGTSQVKAVTVETGNEVVTYLDESENTISKPNNPANRVGYSSTTETKYYSDEACTNEIDDPTK